MILTCLAEGCKEQVPAWSKLCTEHLWMATVERTVDAAMDEMFDGRPESAIRWLELAIKKIREEGGGDG